MCCGPYSSEGVCYPSSSSSSPRIFDKLNGMDEFCMIGEMSFCLIVLERLIL
jgi:hypothetical protein